MRLLRRKSRTFEIQVQDLTLHVQAAIDVDDESRAAALSFWEVLHAYSIGNPDFRTSKRPVTVPADAPEIVREMAATAGRAGVGPMFSFQGAVTDHVGRFVGRAVNEVTVNCGGEYFIRSRRRQKLTVCRRSGTSVAVVVPANRQGVGISMTSGQGRTRTEIDGLAVLAESCMLAGAAAAGVRAILPKQDGLRGALAYLRRVPGVIGGVVFWGERIGMAGGLELAA